MSPLPHLPGVLTTAQVDASADGIAALQHSDGMIPWWEDGHADPWNHTEAAMALAAAGRRIEASRAFDWLQATQNQDGSWFSYYRADG
ncbi:MAG TPA: hypothetical protein VMY34_10470, partial [Acidimicrobiales bacterium]|nr:hypothetical protein [Acidimicrobiales bacterium]